ncbi:MAG: hypothetical protein JST92_08665 [Deltaproteobacteria bacterium]|nr:hypothetical protein [Deltaproteobacteria bacterium]
MNPLSRMRWLLVVGVLAAGCGTVRVKVPLVRPAEVNLAAYKTLALTNITGAPRAGPLVGGMLEEKLMETRRFEIVDREHMGAVMNELKLSASDLSAQNGAAKLGQLVTAGALITCELEEHYEEHPREQTFTDNKGAQHTRRWIEAKLRLRGSFRLTDVSTGKLLLVRVIETEAENEAHAGLKNAGANVLGALLSGAVRGGNTSNESHPPDREKMEHEAATELVDRFVGAIAPRKEQREVEFAKDGDLPQLATGIGWAQRGDWKKAQSLFDEAIKGAEANPNIASSKLAKAYLDAGLSRVYAGEFEEGMKLLSRGYDLSGDSKLLDEIDRAKVLQAESKTLSEQAPAEGGQ